MFNFDEKSKNDKFCMENIYLFSTRPTQIDEINRYMKSEQLTLQVLGSSKKFIGKKSILLVCQNEIDELLKQFNKNDILKNHFIYTFSKDANFENKEISHGHIKYPFQISEIMHVLHICNIKSYYEAKIENLNKNILNLEKISALGRYTGSLVHDLNNYNTICMTALDGIKIVNKKGINDKNISFLVDKGLKGTRMLNQLSKKYRKFLYAEETTEIDYFPLQVMIEEALDYMNRDLQLNNIKITVDVSVEEFIFCNDISFIQILMNLISNSIYSIKEQESKWISIKSEISSEEEFNLIITDSGNGILPHILERIYDPLFTTKSNGEGSGFGLSFCRSELVSLGMTLSYKDVLNTTFVIGIPMTKIKKSMLQN